ncbi:hypothetical protein [Belliella pelovolcani]|uniref:hypothetical protein n=1 Tax=Belliella pelovolcani TaxID=529505 RepID=UPI00391DAE17
MKKFLIFALLTFSFILGTNTTIAQTADQPDLRIGDCTNCKGNKANYSILNVYFSDVAGNPSNICDTKPPFYITILYTSNANNDINNFRIIADILKKDRTTNETIGSPFYINEFVGTIPPCKGGICTITIPIPDLGFDCLNEFYELSNPLVLWTTASKKDLEDKYVCTDYPSAQCVEAESIPIEVGILSYSFEPRFECFRDDFSKTQPSLLLTSLFGGNPIREYILSWEFTMPDGTTIYSSDANPTLPEMPSGEKVTAKLTISQTVPGGSPLVGDTVTVEITIPSAFSLDDMVTSSEITETEEGKATGSIVLELAEGDYFYYWTSLDDPEFYSEAASIEDLPEGTYALTTIDLTTGLCRLDIFDVGARILPVELLNPNARFESSNKTSFLSWATAKENANSHFEIERSDKGIDDFRKIGEVDGMGWKDTVTEYQFIDEKLPLSGGNLFYRIKQVDFDGKYTYSKVLSVRAEGVQATTGAWRAFPNPTLGDQLRISLLDRTQYDEEPITFRIVHPTLVTQAITVNSENEMNDQLATIIPRAPKGVLVVEIQWGQKVEHIKVLKK